MKCPSCGAEIESGKVCSYCGAQISSEMLREQEILNKAGCPKCGSTNVSYRRENQGEIRGKNSKQVVHQTVGLCKDCGYTWIPTGEQPVKKRKTWLWVLGWIFIFPLPLTLILLKKKEMKPVIKYGIIAVAWLLYLIIAFAGKGADKPISEQSTPSVTDTKLQDAANSEQETERTAKDADSQTEVTEADDNVSIEFKNALKKAESYSKTMHMSKQAIYDQLTSEYGERFPADAAQYAIDNLQADYNANALKKAESYCKTMHMSKRAIFDQLISENGEKFTEEEAQYAVDNLVADYNENALAKAKNYQEKMNMSSSSIYNQLISEYGEKFTPEEAQYAIDHLD